MKTLARIAKWIGALVPAAIVFAVIVANFGTVESPLECSGQILHDGERNASVIAVTPATLYAKVETWRWFVVWAEHDAMITWEIQPGYRSGFGYYNHNDFGTSIEGNGSDRSQGYFSPLSKQIKIFDSGGRGTFDGKCK